MSNAGFLLDTNAISEGRRQRPNAAVTNYLRSIRGEQSFVSVVTLGELRKGVAVRARTDKRGAAILGTWIDEIEGTFANRILPIDLDAARLWGELSAVRPRPVADTLIAATAIVRGMTLVTPNVRDVADTGVAFVNPWEGSP